MDKCDVIYIGLNIRINIIDLKELIDAYLESQEENVKLKAKIIELANKEMI